MPRWPPTRGGAIRAVIALAVFVSAVVGITNGALAGITLLLGFSGVLSLTLLFVPSRPEIVVTLRGEENATADDTEIGLIVGAKQTIRPLDVDQIVKNQEHAALETMPRAPTPKVPPGSALAPIFDLNQSTANMLSAVGGASDEELEAFINRVREYGDTLRAWLEQLQASRAERLRLFVASARVHEGGQAPADFTRIRLRFHARLSRKLRRLEPPKTQTNVDAKRQGSEDPRSRHCGRQGVPVKLQKVVSGGDQAPFRACGRPASSFEALDSPVRLDLGKDRLDHPLSL
jgi:hypothetical protein